MSGMNAPDATARITETTRTLGRQARAAAALMAKAGTAQKNAALRRLA